MADEDEDETPAEEAARLKQEEADRQDLDAPETLSDKDLDMDSDTPEPESDEDVETELQDEKDTGREALEPQSNAEEIAKVADKETEDHARKEAQTKALIENENAVNAESPQSAAPLANPITTASSQNPQLDRFQNYMDQYRKLQDQQRKGDLVNGLLAAGGKVGQSMAGKYSGNFVPDQTGNQMLAKMNERPMQNFTQGLAVEKAGMGLNSEQAAMDPTSPQSQLVRSYIKQRFPGIPVPETMSAADAQMLMKTIGKPIITKYQKVTGTYTDPSTGETKRVSASYDPTTRQYTDDSGKPLPGFVQESLAPIQYTKDAKGNIIALNKGAITQNPQTVSSSSYAPVSSMTPQQVQNFRPDQPQQKALDDSQKSLDSQNKMRSETLDQIDKAERMLNSGSKLTAANMPIMMVPISSGLKRVNTYELDAWSGAKDLASRVDQWVATHADSELTPANKAEFQNLLAQYKQSVNNASLGAQQRAAQHLELTRSIPASFSAKALGVQQSPSNNDKVHVQNIETGQDLIIPRANLQKALDSKKYREM